MVDELSIPTDYIWTVPRENSKGRLVANTPYIPALTDKSMKIGERTPWKNKQMLLKYDRLGPWQIPPARPDCPLSSSTRAYPSSRLLERHIAI